MKNLYKEKREQGFTIIEVMIVLAIAAVILLIVLLAVPALQRNSRNTQRNNDAATLAAAINTCMANHNSVTASCSGTAASGQAVDIDWTKMGQLTSASVGSAASTTNANWTWNKTCPAGGVVDASNPLVTATSREFALQFQIETTGTAITRCISS